MFGRRKKARRRAERTRLRESYLYALADLDNPDVPSADAHDAGATETIEPVPEPEPTPPAMAATTTASKSSDEPKPAAKAPAKSTTTHPSEAPKKQSTPADEPGPEAPADPDDRTGPTNGRDDAPDPDESEETGTTNDAEPTPSNGDSGLDHDAVNEKVRKVMDSIQGLEHLSELVSLRYNPFLEMNENDVFDGKRLRPDDLVQGFFSPTGDVSSNPAGQVDLDGPLADHASNAPYVDSPSILPDDEFPSFMEVAHVPRRGSDDLDESIDLTDLPVEEIHSAIGRPPSDPRPPEEPNGGSDGGSNGGVKPVGHGAPLSDRDRARRTLLVLSWFRQIQTHGPPSCLFLFIDHCRRMEWIDASSHKWLTALADGVTTRDPELTWDTLGLDPVELTHIHEANLLFLDDLFSDRLRPGERGYLNAHIGDYFEVN